VISNLIVIEGVTTVALSELVDEHGSVLHMLRSDTPEFIKFGECYFSEVLPGAVKAWKLHREQTQNIAVPVGRVRLVIYDDRVGSGTKGNLRIQELGRPDAYLRVKLPPGLWYGFACIGNTPALLANCADLPHAPTESERKPAFDLSIPYDWQIQKK
jgi:dTDP-4-dehydrorhamnose 3,5-epimerase